PFDHHAPTTLEAAIDLLAAGEGQAMALAGGSDLLLRMKAGVVAPRTVISLRRLTELQGLEFDQGQGLRIGALVTLRELERSAALRAHYPALAHAAEMMASEQVRSFATIGGNLCNASPAADLPPPLIALGAEAVLVSSPGERTVPLEDFFLGPGESALAAGELLKAVRVPPPTGSAVYLRHTPRARMDIAVVSAAVAGRIEGSRCIEARIVLGAVAPVPLRAREAEALLTGRDLTPSVVDAAATAAAAECAPIDDVRGAAWYRRRMVKVLVARGMARLAVTEEQR
ncbi:MAG: FAD binding domain-containing protein, partial [Anaerolineae bacterium]